MTSRSSVDTYKQRFYLVLLVFFCSLFLHLFRLGEPPKIVFDEIYFVDYAESYCCSGKYFRDGHPPAGKLLVAAAGYLAGHETGMNYRLGTGSTYTEGSAFYAMRLVPALLASMTPIVVILIFFVFGFRTCTAILGGVFFLFENALLAHSRIVSLDPLLILGLLAALLCFGIARTFSGRSLRLYYFSLVCMGVFCGVAFGTKLTGMTGFLIPGCFFVANIAISRGKDFLRELKEVSIATAVIMVAGMLVYSGFWRMHAHLLAGTKDRLIDLYSTDFFGAMVEQHKDLFSYHLNTVKRHPYESPWWSWPLMRQGVGLWRDVSSRIYLIGNPLVWRFSTLFLVIGFGMSAWLLRKEVLQAQKKKVQFLIAMLVFYSANFLPYIMISRSMFLYHYFPSYVIALLIMALIVGESEEFGKRTKRTRLLMAGVICTALVGFVLMLPASYGIDRGSALGKVSLWFFDY